MTQKLSRRVQAVRPSATLAFSARAMELKRQGRDVVSLPAGEPDFPVPPHVEKAIEQALQRGMTKYTASPGVQELREAIADRMEIEIGQKWGIKDIVATAGAKQALYNAFLDEGDEAIVPCPYWVSYPDMVRLAGATAVPLECSGENGWTPRPEALEKAITPKTRAVILGSPSNPTGAVWDEETMRGFARVLEKHPDIAILSDDIYGRLVYGGVEAISILRVAPQLRERTVIVNGCSKAYAMTGLRLGWACGPSAIIAAMNRVQDSSTSNPSSLTQYAGIAALRGPQEPPAVREAARSDRRSLAGDTQDGLLEAAGRVLRARRRARVPDRTHRERHAPGGSAPRGARARHRSGHGVRSSRPPPSVLRHQRSGDPPRRAAARGHCRPGGLIFRR